ncbi:hypothetical protein LTR15_012778 [Elasticomyces elasticus]|nr:hypothetical protein LTR15_012778 [Elasticomyces elasticus]
MPMSVTVCLAGTTDDEDARERHIGAAQYPTCPQRHRAVSYCSEWWPYYTVRDRLNLSLKSQKIEQEFKKGKDEIQLEMDKILKENEQMEEEFKNEQDQIQVKIDSMQIIDDGAARTPSSSAQDPDNVVAAMEAIVEENFQMEKQFKQSRTRFSTKWISFRLAGELRRERD